MKPDFKDVNGEETLKASFEATEMALNLLRASIKNTKLGLNEKEIDLELSRIIRMQREEGSRFCIGPCHKT